MEFKLCPNVRLCVGWSWRTDLKTTNSWREFMEWLPSHHKTSRIDKELYVHSLKGMCNTASVTEKWLRLQEILSPCEKKVMKCPLNPVTREMGNCDHSFNFSNTSLFTEGKSYSCSITYSHECTFSLFLLHPCQNFQFILVFSYSTGWSKKKII